MKRPCATRLRLGRKRTATWVCRGAVGGTKARSNVSVAGGEDSSPRSFCRCAGWVWMKSLLIDLHRGCRSRSREVDAHSHFGQGSASFPPT